MAPLQPLRPSHLSRSHLQLLQSTTHQLTLRPKTAPSPSSLAAQQQQQRRSVATTRRATKALRVAPAATATPNSKYITPATHTLVFNPPPSAPSPYTTPPLFLPASDPRKTLLAQSHAFNNPYASGARPLPPPVRKNAALPPASKKYHLSEADVLEIRRLRAADPWTWTVPKLAEKFGCSKIFVGIAAPASTERREWGLALHQRFRDRWGKKRTEAVEARHKRRRLWERDL